jgi:hypothetical protein
LGASKNPPFLADFILTINGWWPVLARSFSTVTCLNLLTTHSALCFGSKIPNTPIAANIALVAKKNHLPYPGQSMKSGKYLAHPKV